MKINKKFAFGLSSSILVVAPIATVVSCGTNYGKNYEYYGDIQVITDAGSVKDKSFNQSAFEAAQNYTMLSGVNKTFGFSQPKTTTTTLLQKAYLSALKEGSRTLVLPGFTHSDSSGGDAIAFAKRYHSKYPKARYISPDGFAPDETIANKNGFYNLKYASQESGFLAAVYGGLYFNLIKHVSSPIKAATFGGVPIPYGVTSYMDGYLQGIHFFNSNEATLKTTPKTNKTTTKTNKTTPKTNKATLQPIEPVFFSGTKASAKDFTNSFDAGEGTSIAQAYINKDVQMILPVAGPQTGDVIGAIASDSKKGTVYAIGVDVDQSKVYNPDYLLGSAIKGVYISTAYAIKELENRNLPHKPFEKFSLKMETNNTTFQKFQKEVQKSLLNHGHTQKDSENLTKPTGFIPSNSLKGTSLIESKQIYKDALAYAHAGNISEGLSAKSKKQDAIDTYNQYGGFLEIASKGKS